MKDKLLFIGLVILTIIFISSIVGIIGSIFYFIWFPSYLAIKIFFTSIFVAVICGSIISQTN